MAEPMTAGAIRQRFLQYFKDKGHTIEPSSSLVPGDDPTLLFTNAGMVPFKDVFLGYEQRPYTRATSSQRCVRAGGKHNDLDNVGYTARHHTFFEMLGNFSFGDYFKREAIRWAWDFLTQVCGLPEDKLWVTVYEDDAETEAIWLDEMKVSKARFSRCGKKDNFWSMGATGPCGPCTEIFYDHGPDVPGGPPGSPDEDGDRYIEIWNIVFMQYNSDAQGVLTPLPRPCVDTGMGLERISAVLQGVHNNYDIDVFAHIIQGVIKAFDLKQPNTQSLQVLADHIRSVSFLILDGIVPGNEGRAYVLRRILRRALRHGHKLGLPEPFFYRLVPLLVDVMGEAYPDLKNKQKHIASVIRDEEARFAQTLKNGMALLDGVLKQAKDHVDGEVAFRLYDTYGFPLDLTADIAREHGLTVDQAGFDRAMARQQAASKAASAFEGAGALALEKPYETHFLGYDGLNASGVIEALFYEGEAVEGIQSGQAAAVILTQTPFYAEAGGQIGDTGTLRLGEAVFDVAMTSKQGSAFVHWGVMRSGSLACADTVEAQVDAAHREAVMRHHSATHLLHAALRAVLGEGVQQKGSLVEADRLRFDFTHPTALTAMALARVEAWVNAAIRANHHTEVCEMALDDAKAAGAMALFGEKYGETVRVIRMGDASIELCGGTHVARTGDIGVCFITSESASSAGVRRIEAVAGEAAYAHAVQQRARLRAVASRLNTAESDVEARLEQHMEAMAALKQQCYSLMQRQAQQQVRVWADEAVSVGAFRVVIQQVDTDDRQVLSQMGDALKQRCAPAIILLAGVAPGATDEIALLAMVDKKAQGHITAKALLAEMIEHVGGRGGGRPDRAQGGGKDVQALPAALLALHDVVEKACSTSL